MSMNALQTIDMTLPVGSIDAYYYQVNRIPMLTLEREQELAKKFRENNDLEAARELTLAHLRYVARVARGYAGYGLPPADLIQEGNIGLMKAVKRFDPSMGVRLVSFAVHWIKAEIHEFILKNWRIVKIATTKVQRKLFFNLRAAKKRLGWFTQREMAEVADDLGVSVAAVAEMEQRLNSQDMSFEGHDEEEDNAAGRTSLLPAPVHYLAASYGDPAEQFEQDNLAEKNQSALKHAFDCLDARSQAILDKRLLAEKKATLHELADQYGVSAERIRQIENNALKKLKTVLMQSSDRG